MNDVRRTVRRYMSLAFSHRWLILVPAALCFMAAVTWAVTRDDVYEARALLMSQNARPSDGLIRSSVDATARDLIKAAQERMLDFRLLQSVIEEKDLYAARRKEPGGMEAAVKSLRGRIKINVDRRGTNVSVSLRCSGGERPADRAAEIVNCLTNKFVEEQRLAIKGTALEVKRFLVKGEEERLQELEKAEQRLADFQRANAGQLPADRSTNRSIISQVENRIETLLSRQTRNRDEIERYTIASFELEQKLRVETRVTRRGDIMVESFRGYLADLKAKLGRALVDYAEESDYVQDLQAQIREGEAQLEELLGDAVVQEDGSADFYRWLLDTYKARQEDLTKDIEQCKTWIDEARQQAVQARERIEAADRIEADYVRLQRDAADAKRRRDNLLGKRELAEFAVDFQEYDPTIPIEVAQEAYPAAAPVGPPRVIYSIAGLVVGFAVGIGVLLARMLFDDTLHRPDDLRLLLPGTIVVTVPEIADRSIRVSKVLGNVMVGLLVTVLFAGSFAVLGLRVGWWGEPSMLDPLLNLKLPFLS